MPQAGAAARPRRAVPVVVALALGAVVACGLTACSGESTEGGDRDGNGSTPRSTAADGGGVDCGTERLTFDDVDSDEPRRCFVQAVTDRQVATFVSIAPSTEGDPIVTTLTSDPSGTITVLVDTSEDAFRGEGPALTTFTCTSIEAAAGEAQDPPAYIAAQLHGCTAPTPA